jgi:hypothetical protein
VCFCSIQERVSTIDSLDCRDGCPLGVVDHLSSESQIPKRLNSRWSLVRQLLCYSYRFLDDRTPSRHSERFGVHAQNAQIRRFSARFTPSRNDLTPQSTSHSSIDSVRGGSTSTAICLKLSHPSLFSSCEISGVHEMKGKKRKNLPQLILNPSNVPIETLALSQTDQIRSRAIGRELRILRCNSLIETEREN